MAHQLKILFFDIETSPRISYHWRDFKEFIGVDQAIEDPFMLTWAAKWRGGKQIYTDKVTSTEAKKRDDIRIVKSMADKIREADIIIAHNVDKFDLPMVNTRLVKTKSENLDIPQTIDTLKLARKNFNFRRNSLNGIARELNLGQKVKTDFDLWKRSAQGDNAAIREMQRYNKQDVRLLERVFEAMLPYCKGVPRLVDASEWRERACPFCGSHDTQGRGWRRTRVNTYQKRQCNECHKYFQAYQATGSKKLGYNAL